MEDADTAEPESLLVPVDDSGNVIPHPLKNVVKFWISSQGGAGCFRSNRNQDTLNAIADNTGTEIQHNLKGLKVSGKSAVDVDDAFSKLTRVEESLVCKINLLGKSHLANTRDSRS